MLRTEDTLYTKSNVSPYFFILQQIKGFIFMQKVNFLVTNVSSYAQKFLVECLRKEYFVGVRYYDRTDSDGYSTRHAVVCCYQDKNDLLEYHEKVQKFNAIFDKLPSPTSVSVQGDLPN